MEEEKAARAGPKSYSPAGQLWELVIASESLEPWALLFDL